MKKIIITILVVILAAVVVYLLIKSPTNTIEIPEVDENIESEINGEDQNGEEVDQTSNEKESVLGQSFNGHSITAYHYGDGDDELVFVGGIHGAYEWNTVLVAYELMDYLESSPSIVPSNVKVTVIPVLNPDGLNKVVGSTGRFSRADVPSSQEATVPGRFNGNNVDLNRNFDCDWQTNAVWQNNPVSGGTAAFSEPESRAFRDYINVSNPKAVVFWYSAANGVFTSNCHNGVLEETSEITNIYADASDYPAYKEFNFYEITGDAVNWLAKENIPAISVLLSTHEDVEWSKNRAGVEALLEYYAQ
ncbi:MAG: M14 family metallopeptidase [Candidatus Paceibacterota bacterium]